jgi:hypothetical protein
MGPQRRGRRYLKAVVNSARKIHTEDSSNNNQQNDNQQNDNQQNVNQQEGSVEITSYNLIGDEFNLNNDNYVESTVSSTDNQCAIAFVNCEDDRSSVKNYYWKFAPLVQEEMIVQPQPFFSSSNNVSSSYSTSKRIESRTLQNYFTEAKQYGAKPILKMAISTIERLESDRAEEVDDHSLKRSCRDFVNLLNKHNVPLNAHHQFFTAIEELTKHFEEVGIDDTDDHLDNTKVRRKYFKMDVNGESKRMYSIPS